MALKGLKQFAVGKAFGKGAEVTDEQLVKIRKFALEEIPAEQLYVRKIRLAHSAIDRDGERFSEEILRDFTSSLPGKSLLMGHQWGPPGQGIFFDAWLEEKSLSDARQITGEKLQLPQGVDKVSFLMAAFYTVKTASREDLLADIDGGVVRHASIGFNAADRIPVRDEKDAVLYREYKGPGEALEGSLVWLGAQPGATTTKAAGGGDGDHIEEEKTKKQKEEKRMIERIKALLKLGADATEEAIAKAIAAMTERLKFTESIVAALGGDEVTVDQVREMKLLAADGRAYKTKQVENLVRFERMLDGKKETDEPEAVTARRGVLMGRPVTEIDADIKRLQPIVFARFPAESSITGSDPSKGRKEGDTGGEGRKTFRKEGRR